MKHLALFNGIGGFQLAAHWMGWNNVTHVEIDEFCNKVVAKHFPESKCYLDIKKFNGKEYEGTIDIITGGFPCQPYSAAGKRKGKEDERHLWPEMLRTIREIQPPWVVGENVSGLVNWNDGMVFNEVQADLEAESYEVIPFLLPACSVNAPHKRERVWFIAYSDLYANRNIGKQDREKNSLQRIDREEICSREFIGADTGTTSNTANSRIKSLRRERENSIRRPIDVADTNNERLQGSKKQRSTTKSRENADKQFAGLLQPTWEKFPTQSPLCGRDDGVPDRMDRIKALGNAIVPQVAYQIFKAIEQTELF